ncbi:MAG TPA: PAS domain S-box protein, partial [Bryobacteraceae bacterium]|nr:PAS domain S-box protein [Bryobacteraceae bacterium]
PLRRLDGTLADVECIYNPSLDENGTVTGFVALMREVDDRSFTSETHDRLAAIIDSSDDAIVSKTLDGVITSWNRSAERIFGYTASEAVGQHITLIIPPERRAEEDGVLARLRRGEKVDHFETERRTKDGRTVYISLSVAPVRNTRGELVGAAKVARDITAQKQAELALEEVEEYRRAVLESMPECVKVLDPNGNVVHMNAAGLRMVEASSPEEVVGKCVYPIIEESDREAFRTVNESVFSGGPGGSLEFSIRGLKGGLRVFETNVVPLRGGASPAVIGALSVTRDITARKQTELRDAFLVRLDDQTRPLSDPKEITAAAARLLAEHLDADRCAYAEIDSSELMDVVGDHTRGVPSIVGKYPLSAFGSTFVDCTRAGRNYVVLDSEAEIDEPDILEAYRATAIRAVVSVPLIKQGQLVAGMAVHQTTTRVWREPEIELVRLVANRCWESIERARVERELRESESQFRTLANTIPNLAWMGRSDGQPFWFNRRLLEYTGRTEDELRGWGWEILHDPARFHQVRERWQHSVATGQHFEMVFPLRRADGQFREFLTRIEPIQDDRGQVIRWFGTGTDITVLQEAERREKSARETAEVLNRVGPVLSAELDPEKLSQKIIDIATEAVRGQYGALLLTGAEAIVQRQEWYASTPGAPSWLRDLSSLADASVVRLSQIPDMPGVPAQSYLAVPVRSRTGAAFGSLYFAHSEEGAFTPEAETIARGIAAQAAIALDNAFLFAETKRASEALRRSNDELRRLNDDLNQFAYSASHDLREPLRMVAIYTQLLQRRLSSHLDEESGRYIDRILKGASRLESLIRDLLAYTRAAEAPEQQGGRASTSVAVEESLANLATAVDEAGAVVIVNPDLPIVAMSQVHLTQVLQNLIGNALKYRTETTPEIRVGSVRTDEGWEIFVVDNGIGIAADFQKQIFGIFRRLHNADEYSGTGIGLAICQRILERYGCRIWVESEPGRGSTFRFTAPSAE